jgi:peptide/histidine transporter 3/4
MATTTTTVGRNGEGEQKRREKGGFKTMPFILGEEIA